MTLTGASLQTLSPRPQLSSNNPTSNLIPNKPKSKPNFEFRPLDKDSFSQNMGSISETTLEGTLLAQSLPVSKSTSATKLPPSTLKPQNGFPSEEMRFKVKNRDTGNENAV